MASNPGSSRGQGVASSKLDRISGLPDEILVHILSFLPAVDLVRASRVPRFSGLWTSVHSLNFSDKGFISQFAWDSDDGDEDDDNHDYVCPDKQKDLLRVLSFMRVVMTKVVQAKTKVQKVNIEFKVLTAGDIIKYGFTKTMEKLVEFMVSKEIKVFKLDFALHPVAHFSFPGSVFTSQFLTEIDLFQCKIPELGQVDMPSLKIVKFIYVDISQETFQKIIQGCPSLCDVDLSDCRKLLELKFSTPNIENLRLRLCGTDEKVTLDCPNLKSFWFRGCLERLQPINLSSLVYVTFDSIYTYYRYEEAIAHYIPLLEKLRHAEIVKFSDQAIGLLVYGAFKNIACPSNEWKHVTVTVDWIDMYLAGLLGLFRSSPYLEELVIFQETTISTDSSRLSQGLQNVIVEMLRGGNKKGTKSKKKKKKEWVDADELLNYDNLTLHLKSVTMNGIAYDTCRAQLEFLEIILEKAVVLEKLVIKMKRSSFRAHIDFLPAEVESCFTRRLLSLPKASPNVVISFS